MLGEPYPCFLKLCAEKFSNDPQNAPNNFFIHHAPWVAKYLTLIFQKSAESGTVSLMQKVAKVLPAFQSGGRQAITN